MRGGALAESVVFGGLQRLYTCLNRGVRQFEGAAVLA